MKLGIVSKKDVKGNIILERRMLGIHQLLRLTRDRCVGCDVCATACPQEALSLQSAVIKDGRLIGRRIADFNQHKCTFCGACVVLCPTNAIEIETNGKRNIGFVESKVFPTLMKEIKVDVNKCQIECNQVCQDSCPTKAIEVVLNTKEKTETPQIERVNVDKESCIFCKKCKSACPKDAINVIESFSGFVELNPKTCPKSCQVCIDSCPAKAISTASDGKPLIEERFCIYCGACQEACPENMISVRRTGILHSDTNSGAWITALEKLTSRTQMVKQLNSRARRKTREASKSLGRF